MDNFLHEPCEDCGRKSKHSSDYTYKCVICNKFICQECVYFNKTQDNYICKDCDEKEIK